MEKALKVGILRETKDPPDRRVPLIPQQIITLGKLFPFVEFYVQPSNYRCYSNEEYENLNIPLREDLRNCDILMGVKEVDQKTFLQGKTYLFFSHVGKKQTGNDSMLREILRKEIRLIDYEYLTSEHGKRVVAFGRYAGIVGAYNGLRAIGIKTNLFDLKPAHQFQNLDEMWAGLRLIKLKPGLKILVTGEGRVAKGALETLNICRITRVTPADFLTREFNVPVFCQIGTRYYVHHKEGHPFLFPHFKNHPQEYESTFLPYTKFADIMIACHYWDPRSPMFFSKNDMKKSEFRISVIADISCDINGPIPSTIRATTISDPFFNYNPHTGLEEPLSGRAKNITVMSIDNLPGELPRDASHDFGLQLIENVLPDLFDGNESKMIRRATITSNGVLTRKFEYLKDYIINNS